MNSDPGTWNEKEITAWLKWCTKKFKIKPKPVRSRLPNTGRELVDLTRSDFWVVAGSGVGGNKLAQYIALMVHNATGREMESLHSKEDPGKNQNRYLLINM